MGAREFQEWKKFFELEGFGDDRMDLRFARLMHLFANAYNDDKKNPRGYKLEEFLYDWQKPADDFDNFGVDEIRRKREALKAKLG